MMARFATLFLVLAALHVATAFYLPGVAPRKYSPGEQLHIRMTTMTSSDDELLRDYYRINFCAPEGEQAREYPENLGELLVGERSESSVYEIYALDNQYCKVACSKEWTQDDVKTWYELAADNYRVNMCIHRSGCASLHCRKLDNLPAAELFSYTGTDGAEHSYYQLGYSLGSVATCEAYSPPRNKLDLRLQGNQTCNWYIHNHVTFKILYHRVNSSYESIEESGVLIVGFDIFPRSIQHSVGDDNTPQGCLEEGPLTINVGPDAPEKQPVHFTYDVTWEHSDIKWASRWDVFLNVAQTDIHWFSVVNSIVVLALLSGMVAMIMLRILRKDVYRYNRVSDSESEEMTQEMREETGWKLVCADVFRPPRAAALLAVCVGSGVQVIGMTSAAMVFASLGLLNPSNRGGLLSVMIAVFIIMGNPAGFCAAVFAKRMQVQSRLKIAILTASLIPGVIFAIFFVLNMVIWGERSVGAVPFGTIVALCVLWFIAVPLVFLGSFWGFRKELSDTPTRTNSIPREVPEQPWYMTLWPSVLMGAVLPFGVVFVELFFVLSAIWQHRFYYLFGFIMLVIFILIITCAEITIVMTYFQLCSEDYHWWWRAFLTAGCSAVYFFLYSMMHYFRHLHHSGHPWASTFIYCCYSLIVSYMFFFLTGVAGFIPTYVFVWVIYSSIKVD